MRYAAAFCLLVAMLTPSPAPAQQWSAEQLEVIDHIKVCWDAWVEAEQAKDAEIWVNACRGEDSTSWWGVEGAPATVETIRRNIDRWASIDLGWSDIRPVVVNILDDVAVVHFYGYWRAATPAGEVLTEDRRTAVFRKRDGVWHFLTEHSTPVTPADADPYR